MRHNLKINRFIFVLFQLFCQSIIGKPLAKTDFAFCRQCVHWLTALTVRGPFQASSVHWLIDYESSLSLSLLMTRETIMCATIMMKLLELELDMKMKMAMLSAPLPYLFIDIKSKWLLIFALVIYLFIALCVLFQFVSLPRNVTLWHSGNGNLS